MKRTKIICTMGPSTDKKTILRKLVKGGMDIARYNFSHGTHEEQLTRVNLLKDIREELNMPVALLLDTKGPEIRTGLLKEHQKVTLTTGQEFTLTAEEIEGDNACVSITYPGLVKDVKAGNRILLDDGLIELEVLSAKGTNIVCKVLNGGELGERKGVNVPNVKVKLPAITDKDKEDILWGIQHDFDFIAASFVRDAKAVREIRALLNENGGEHMSIISKIENAEGIENIDKIIEESDGIMIARGDLGVEIPPHMVPHIQKEIIRKCNEQYVPVITATQMLDSMIRNPRPTRAEVADVANAIYDGTDAIMLSGETAAGKYPVEALKMMAQIAISTEPNLANDRFGAHRMMYAKQNVSSAVGAAAVFTVENLNADAIVTPTISGQTALLISSFRPKVPIFAVTPNESVQHKLQLYWGVIPVKGYEKTSTQRIIEAAMAAVKRRRYVKKGQLLVFTAGDPATNVRTGEGAVTNMMHVIEVK